MGTDKQRERFEALRAAYVRQKERSDKVEEALRAKYHVGWDETLYSHVPTKTEQAKREAARAATDKASGKFMDHLDAISPRNWRSGVPAHWVYEELSYEDAVRPRNEKLGVVSPLAYGHTVPMT